MLGTVLEHGRPLKLEPPVLEIGYPQGSFMTGQLQEEDVRRDLEALAAEYFGAPVKLKISTVAAEEQDAPKSLIETRQEKETDRMRRLREDAMQHPALKTVQDVFHGEIRKVIPIDKGFV
jgi:DNA polymerase-3 subunit gamma/tau